jgi:histidinol phosphatase-like PHP family hydrolase
MFLTSVGLRLHHRTSGSACHRPDCPVEDRGMPLTGDGHVHSEWSWDTGGPGSDAAGTMQAMCRRALKIGLPALAFTEHLDLTGWVVDQEDLLDHLRPLVGDDGLLTPDPLDVGDCLENIDRCRRQFPELRILSGVEFGQPWIPQWWSEEGGRAITFASDAHTTDALAGNFYEANGRGRALRLPPRPSPRGLLDPLTVPGAGLVCEMRRPKAA